MSELEIYRTQRVEEAATFRAWPIAWTVEQAKSGSYCIVFQFGVIQRWDGDEHGWSAEYPPGAYFEQKTWFATVPKRNGEPIPGAEAVMSEDVMKRLGECGLWNGDMDAFAGSPPNVRVLVDVVGEEWNGRVYYKGNWVNPDADKPKARGSFAPIDQTMLNQLRSKFGGQARALAGAPAATAAAPPVPPVAAPAAPLAQPAVAPTNPPVVGDTPF